MQRVTTPAVLMRKLAYGEFDYIITFLTRDVGKIGAIAKSAKKSTKRFAGALELFTHLELVLSRRGREGLFYLQEVSIKKPFEGLRTDWLKTAYASYWVELVDRWSEKERKLEPIYSLLLSLLSMLDRDDYLPDALSILFQMRFLGLIGLQPDLERCLRCRIPLNRLEGVHLHFALEKGGVVCSRCAHSEGSALRPGLLRDARCRPLTARLSARRFLLCRCLFLHGCFFARRGFLPGRRLFLGCSLLFGGRFFLCRCFFL